jgi:16S rRNA (cytosine967-C5)-methyltransferase
MNGQNPREIAARVLGQRRANGLFVEDLLEIALASSSLSSSSSSSNLNAEQSRTRAKDEDEIQSLGKDRALCQELVFGIVRWQAALDWLIARKTNGREQKSGLQNLLRLGLYQIFWLDRIPDHAAVHETVELAKHGGFGQQAGFINAILRGYLREFAETKKLLSDLKISQPAPGWSHPEWLVARWQKHFGAEKTAQLLEWNNTPPKNFARVNALKFSGTGVSPVSFSATKLAAPMQHTGETPVPLPRNSGDLLTRWREENVEYDFVRRDWLEENLVFELKSHPPLNSLASFRDGWFYIQDPSTLLAACKLGAQPGEMILDLCAAPGGKTTFIAQLIGNEGKIVACDISEERLKLIRENCARLGATCVEPILSSAFSLRPSAFDRILVDAPCSNTGVMRRRVDLRWRISPEEILRLQRVQLDLLNIAATKLKPGGVLIYSTCSLEPEENGEVVKEFLRAHAGFKLENERELLPFADNVDGAYVARLKHST